MSRSRRIGAVAAILSISAALSGAASAQAAPVLVLSTAGEGALTEVPLVLTTEMQLVFPEGTTWHCPGWQWSGTLNDLGGKSGYAGSLTVAPVECTNGELIEAVVSPLSASFTKSKGEITAGEPVDIELFSKNEFEPYGCHFGTKKLKATFPVSGGAAPFEPALNAQLKHVKHPKDRVGCAKKVKLEATFGAVTEVGGTPETVLAALG